MDALAALLRIVHIFSGVAWVGGVLFMVAFVSPAARAAGPTAGPFMGSLLLKTRLVTFFPLAGGLTVLSGLALYGYFGYFRAPFVTLGWSMLTIGVAAGLLAFGQGMGSSAPKAKRMKELASIAAAKPGPPPPEVANEMAQLSVKLDRSARVTLVLMVITLLGMTTFRYL